MTVNTSFTLPSGITLKNRIIKSALTEGIADANNFANERHINLYSKWSAGEMGALLTGNVQVDKRFLEGPGNVAIEKGTVDKQFDYLKRWAEAASQNNTQAWMQISHAGRQTPEGIHPSPFSPSDVQLKIPGKKYGKPTPMTTYDIEDVIERFVFTAKIAKEAGFSGIQLHSAHGYLLSQFLSPDINLREDDWGGSIENRSRLLRTIIKECRSELGQDFTISVKLNSADFQKGGFSSEDSIQVAKYLNDLRIDLLEISGGTYEQPRLIGNDNISINPKRSLPRKESTIAREAFFLDYAAKMSAVIEIPLMVTGGFRTMEGMKQALESGACDLVGIGRPICGNPYSVKEMLEGDEESLPSYEKTLRIGPGLLSSQSPIKLIQALNAFSQMAWFYTQIKRMGDGNEPNLELKIFKAFNINNKDEENSLKNIKGTA